MPGSRAFAQLPVFKSSPAKHFSERPTLTAGSEKRTLPLRRVSGVEFPRSRHTGKLWLRDRMLSESHLGMSDDDERRYSVDSELLQGQNFFDSSPLLSPSQKQIFGQFPQKRSTHRARLQ
jgi:hypothetical protein